MQNLIRQSVFYAALIAAFVVVACGDDSNPAVENYQKKSWDFLNPDIKYGEMKDKRDGQIYKTVQIGDQVWMAENLNYEVKDSYCLKKSADNCDKLGRLYTWGAAMDSAGVFSSDGKGCGYTKFCSPKFPVRGVCPEGWHLPDYGEWDRLLTAVVECDPDVACENGPLETLMSKKDMDVKNNLNGENNTDDFGFSAVSAGYMHDSPEQFYSGGAYFWSSTEYDGDGEYSGKYDAYSVMHNSHVFYLDYNLCKCSGYSVRCVKD